jgi:hypothetical protein
MRFLVTGGPVHAHLDDVKIITNKFRGGRMEALATGLAGFGHDVIYLTARHTPPSSNTFATVWLHDGFDDYLAKILKAGELGIDAFVLGAAVANLVPISPWKGKFPSHQYKPGDRVDIPFMVAPRIINDIRRKFPESKLFGFKLLSGAPYSELIEAAHEVALDSRATAVFANDAKDLDRKYAVTKDMVVQPLAADDLPKFIVDYTWDTYYRTEPCQASWDGMDAAIGRAERLVARFADRFQPVGARGLVFGTVACRIPGSGSLAFVTTRRGKTEIGGGWEAVSAVYHENMVVQASGKASLNAPLLHWIFAHVPETEAIVHYHQAECPELHRLSYFPPGTARDSQREVRGSFSIQGHGAFLLFGEDEREPIPWR